MKSLTTFSFVSAAVVVAAYAINSGQMPQESTLTDTQVSPPASATVQDVDVSLSKSRVLPDAPAQRSDHASTEVAHATRPVVPEQPVESLRDEFVDSDYERGLAIVSSLEQVFNAEPLDPAWSSEVNAHIDEAFVQRGWEDSTLLNSACQSTLCKLEFEHYDRQAQSAFMRELPRVTMFAGSAVFYQHVHDDAGASRTVLYMTRTGYPLPL